MALATALLKSWQCHSFLSSGFCSAGKQLRQPFKPQDSTVAATRRQLAFLKQRMASFVRDE